MPGMGEGAPPIRSAPVAGFADPEALAILDLTPVPPDDEAVLLIAGRAVRVDGPVVLSAVRGGAGWVVWTGGRAAPEGHAADLVALTAGVVLALVPDQVLLRLDRLFRHDGPRCRAVGMTGALPRRLFGLGGDVMALFVAADGATGLATVLPGARDGAAPVFGAPWPGPVLRPGQSVGKVLRDAEARLVVTADDPVRGFQLWREAAGGWEHLVTDGAARHACNASVEDATLWQGQVVLAVGRASARRRDPRGLPLSGEILLLGTDGAVRIFVGELRGSRSGLMVPLLSPASPAALERGTFTRLSVATGDLLALSRRHDGGSTLFAFTAERGTARLGRFDGPVCALAQGAEGPRVLVPERAQSRGA